MKEYKVFYACERESAFSLKAGSMEEAAYLYFMNNPRKTTIFIESSGFFGGKFMSYKQLSDSFPDVPEILENLESQRDVIREKLEVNHGFRLAPKDDDGIERFFARNFIGSLIFSLIALIILIYGALKGL